MAMNQLRPIGMKRTKIIYAILNRNKPAMQEKLNELLAYRKKLEPLTTFHKRYFMHSNMHLNSFPDRQQMEKFSNDFFDEIFKELGPQNVIRIKLFINPYSTMMRAMVVYNEL